MILVPLFDLKFLNELAVGGAGISKSAARAPRPEFIEPSPGFTL
jgi:hypothetical protein